MTLTGPSCTPRSLVVTRESGDWVLIQKTWRGDETETVLADDKAPPHKRFAAAKESLLQLIAFEKGDRDG